MGAEATSALEVWLRRAAYVLAAVVGLFAATIITVWLFLKSPFGEALVVDAIVTLIAEGGDFTVAIGDIDGNLPSELALEGVVVRDLQGDWLTIDRLSLEWQPLALFSGRVVVESLSAGTVTVPRAPVLPESNEDAPALNIDELAALLSQFRVQKFQVDRIQVEPELAGQSLTLSLNAGLDVAETGRPQLRVTISDLEHDGEAVVTAVLARNEVIRAQLEAAFNGSEMTAQGTFSVPDNSLRMTGAFNVLPSLYPTDAFAFSSAKAEFDVTGPVDAPRVNLAYTLDQPKIEGVELNRLDGTGDFTWDGEQLGLDVAGGAVGLRALAPELAALLGEDARYDLTGRLTPQSGTGQVGELTLSEATFESGDLKLLLAGVIDLGQISGAGTASVSANSLGQLIGWSEDVSQTTIELDISAASLREVRATFTGASNAVTANSETLTKALAGPITLKGELLASPQRLRIENGSIAGLNGTLDGNVDVNLTDRSVAADLQATLTELQSLSDDLAGAVAINGTVSGPVEAPQVELRLTSDRLAIRQETVDAVNLAVASDLAQTPLSAVVSGSMQIAEGEVVVDVTAIQTAEDILRLDPLSLKGAGIEVAGDLDIDLTDGIATGQVDADFETLAFPSALIAVPLSGRAEASLTLSSEGQAQKAEFSVGAESIRYAGAEAGLGEFNVDGAWLGGETSQIDIVVDGGNGFFGDQAVAAIEGKLSGPLSAIDVALTIRAPEQTPALALSGQLDVSTQATIIDLAEFSLTDTWGALVLSQPARLQVSESRIITNEIKFNAVDGKLTAQVELDQAAGAVKASLTGEDLPFALLETIDPDLPVRGRFALKVNLEGPLTGPRGSAQLNTIDVALPDTGLDAVSIDIDLTLAEQRLTVSSSVAGISETPATITGSLPVYVNLAEGQIRLPMDDPADLSVNWSGDIQPVWAVLPLISHRMTGAADIDLELSGTLNTPLVTGYARLAEGTYENLDLGTLLQDISLSFSANTVSDLSFDMSGTDGDGGQVSGNGALVRGVDGDLSGDLSLNLDRLRLVRRDDVKIKGSGDVTYSLTPDRDRMEGNIQVDSGEISLTASYAEPVPTLDVIDPNAPKAAQGPQRAGKETDLAITITAPRGIDVVGRGLESEWTADVELGGTLASPELTGGLDVARGEFSFLGELFELTRGEVRFTGGGQIDPDLSIIATRTTGGITARVEVSGRASAPTITLGSNPPLPQDEVLSRIIFGKSAGQLGPLEAVQLANAAAELTGLAGRGGVVGTLRRSVGLDVFRFGSDAGGSTVVVGERLSKNIFVGVEQGLEGQGSQLIIEWQLTDNLSLKSTNHQETGADIGLRWSRDY